MANQTAQNKPFWTEFFALYESLPAVWDMKSEEYKDRKAKLVAYDLLSAKLREVEPNADRDEVVRKINIFRTNYRREISRINTSKKLGDRVYNTSLWYFNLLSFLQGQEVKRDRQLRDTESTPKKRLPGSSEAIQEQTPKKIAWLPPTPIEVVKEEFVDGNVEGNAIVDEEPIVNEPAEENNTLKQTPFQTEFQSFSIRRQQPPPKNLGIYRKGDCITNTNTNIALEQQPKHWHNTTMVHHKSPTAAYSEVQEPETSADILAKSWALQYAEMSDDQKIYARKAIADILFEGCLGNLHRDSIQINELSSASSACTQVTLPANQTVISDREYEMMVNENRFIVGHEENEVNIDLVFNNQ